MLFEGCFMIRLRYRLNQENFKELNSYLAVHDKKMQKKLMLIIFSLIVFVIALNYLIFHLSTNTILLSAVGILLVVFLMPRIYWSMVFKRVDHFVESTEVTYHDIEAEIEENIRIKEKNSRIVIEFDEIVNFDYTKHNCILFYESKGRIDTLIFPIDAFEEGQLKEFHFRLMEKKNGETGSY